MEKGYDSKIFSKKRKQKYPRNKFFSYSGVSRDDKDFSYKDFRNSNSIHSSFKRCKFFGTLFKKSKLKYCSFGGCNFKGSRFLGAIFDNCFFNNCIFEKCKFKNAQFINTYVKNSSFKDSSGLKLDLIKYDISKLNMVDDMVLKELSSKYTNTNVENFINKVDISRLLNVFEIELLEKILDVLKENDRIDSVILSHVLKKIR